MDLHDLLRSELILRRKHYISRPALSRCIETSGIDLKELEKRIQFNYALMIPLAWSLRLKDTSRDILLNSYVKDMQEMENNGVAKPLGVGSHENPLRESTFFKEENTIRLATYNIHYWTDSYQIPNVESILYVMKQLNADILALQEALMPYNSATDASKLTLLGYTDKIQPIPETDMTKVRDPSKRQGLRSIYSSDGWYQEDLIDELVATPGFVNVASSAASTTHSLEGTFFGNALLSTKKYPMWLAQGLTLPSHYQGRSATISSFPNIKLRGVKESGILVISIHLDVFDDTGATRKKQIQYLLDYLNSIEEIRDAPIIIMGDFNALKQEDYTSFELQWLKDNNQRAPLEFETIKMMENAGFQDVFHLQNPCSLKSTTWAARRVDYIFIKNIPVESIHSTYVYYSDASDHCPIIVDLYIE
jgi:endonuclease/exonuclease/phosphatase family metal-dependent hydrolase